MNVSPMEPTDDELIKELKRVRSDVGFRKWIRTRVKIVAALVAFDLIVSLISIAAIIGVRVVQQEGCHRDNDLRRAYINQWQPVLDDAKTKDDPSSRATVQRFEVTFEAFKTHPC